MMLSDCERFFYAKTYSDDFYDSYSSDDSEDSYGSDSSDGSNVCNHSYNSNYFEDILEPSKISIFFLNIWNKVLPIGETTTTNIFLSFGRNGELICA